MASGEQLASIARRFDRQLRTLEDNAAKSLITALQAAERRLEAELKHLYLTAGDEVASVGRVMRELRARQLLAQVRSLLDVANGISAESVYADLIRRSYLAGGDSALAMLTAYQASIAGFSAIVPLEVAAAATNAAARLAHHGAEFASKAEQVIIDGIIRGRGWSRTAGELRRAVGTTASHAEMLVRTESVTAADTARRAAYVENGVEYVQRMATMDERVCGWCADRAGNVYPVDEAPAALHPNDRCFNAPWKKEWQELGLTDDDWFRDHKRDALAKSEDDRHTGPAPFERLNDLTPPTPVWTP